MTASVDEARGARIHMCARDRAAGVEVCVAAAIDEARRA